MCTWYSRGMPRAKPEISRPFAAIVDEATALVDAPSDYPGEEGLGGFRLAPAHAEDLGKLIEDVRARVKAPVWLAGHSRGTVSVANESGGQISMLPRGPMWNPIPMAAGQNASPSAVQ